MDVVLGGWACPVRDGGGGEVALMHGRCGFDVAGLMTELVGVGEPTQLPWEASILGRSNQPD